MTDLNGLLPAGSPCLAGCAWGINNRGQIVADAICDGVARAILMTPAAPSRVDFDGDGNDDVAIFRPSAGAWHIRNSTDGTMTSISWGDAGDAPLKGRY